MSVLIPRQREVTKLGHLTRCDEVVVLMLDGWRDSVGVAAEIRLAGELGKPVRYLTPGDAVVSPPWAPTFAHVAKETRL